VGLDFGEFRLSSLETTLGTNAAVLFLCKCLLAERVSPILCIVERDCGEKGEMRLRISNLASSVHPTVQSMVAQTKKGTCSNLEMQFALNGIRCLKHNYTDCPVFIHLRVDVPDYFCEMN
jgi:hypothetical protein